MESLIKEKGKQIYHTQKIKKFCMKVGIYLFLGMMAIVVLFPFYWMLISSLKTLEEYRLSVPTLWPMKLMFENYAQAFTTAQLGKLFFNSSNFFLI